MIPKLIVTDLDETLLTSQKTFERDRFMACVQALEAQGALFVVATGNSYHKVEDFFTPDQRQSLYFACDNGNFMVKAEENIFANGVPHHEFLDIIALIESHPGFYPMVSVGSHSYYDEKNKEAYAAFKKYNRILNHLNDYNEIPETETITKIAVYTEAPLAEIKEVVAAINDQFEGVVAMSSGDNWMDAIYKDGGKGKALLYLQDKYNISPNQTLAFGDSLNDASMMEVSKYSVAMANADPDLLALCSYQIGSNQDQAVVTFLEELVEKGDISFIENYRKEREQD